MQGSAPDVEGIAALADPVRRDLYAYVCRRPEPVSREEAAQALELPLHQVKFHLDRLVRAGLLSTGQARLGRRSGPGAGRPAKLYRRVDREIAVSLPEREYALAGELLAEAVTEAAGTGAPVLEAVGRAAAGRGHEIGRSVAEPGEGTGDGSRQVALQVLADHGYEPRVDGDQVLLANCPFHALARSHTDLVCGMNLALLQGVLDELGDSRLTARLDPADGRCCVVLRDAPEAAPTRS